MEKKEIEVAGATEPFYTYTKDGITYYEFDSSMCEPPGPMVNAMSGLKLIDNKDKRLVMINHKKPMGLLPKIETDFDYEVEELEDGKVKLIFSLKNDSASSTDFEDRGCHG
jgi:hypothetical protein